MDKTLQWYKSSRSNGSGACVEVAHDVDQETFIRDTKDREGGTLEVRPAGWSNFVNAVKSGRLV
jgi:hypothetical protein